MSEAAGRSLQQIVFYDGECSFCDRTVQWLLRVDKEGSFKFAQLQGERAAALRDRHPEIPEDIDSIVLLEGAGGQEKVYWHSEAVFRICAALRPPWRFLSYLRFLPRCISDGFYRWFASNRYRFFGKRSACRIPTPEQRQQFLT